MQLRSLLPILIGTLVTLGACTKKKSCAPGEPADESTDEPVGNGESQTEDTTGLRLFVTDDSDHSKKCVVAESEDSDEDSDYSSDPYTTSGAQGESGRSGFAGGSRTASNGQDGGTTTSNNGGSIIATPPVTTPLPGNSGTLSTANVSGTSFTVSWQSATDDNTKPSELSYEVRMSMQDNLATVAQAEANGSIIMPYTTGVSSFGLANLSRSSSYFVAVIVKDADGNKSAYVTKHEKTLADCSGAGLNNDLILNGWGTATRPYVVCTLDQLSAVRQFPTASHVLGRDLDASASSTADGGSGFEPIPAYSGHFDGAGHVISELTINRPNTDNVGLFASLSGTALVGDLGLESVTINGANDVGAIAGTMSDAAKIERSYATNKVNGNARVGGLVGSMRSSQGVENAYFRGLVRASAAQDSAAGGIAGVASGPLRYTFVGGSIRGADQAGAIVGRADAGSNIVGGATVSSVMGSNRIGGIAGTLSASISDSNWYPTEYSVSQCTGSQSGTPQINSCLGVSTRTSFMAGGGSIPAYQSWDFASVWKFDAAGGFPILAWQQRRPLPEVLPDVTCIGTFDNRLAAPTQNFSTAATLQVHGYSPGGYSYFRMAIHELGDLIGVTDAALKLYHFNDRTRDSQSRAIRVGRITSAWNAATLTGASYPNSSFSVVYGTATVGGSGTAGVWLNLGFGQLFSGWLSGSIAPNYGLIIGSSTFGWPSGGDAAFIGQNFGDRNLRPVVAVTINGTSHPSICQAK